MDAKGARRTRPMRTAKSCGSGAAVLALSPREAKLLGDDGGKRADLREEHEVSRKAIAQGRPECSRCPVCSCAFLFAQIARETAGAASTRSSLRPLIGGREVLQQTSGAMRREIAPPILRKRLFRPMARTNFAPKPLPCKSLKFKIYAEPSSWRLDRCPHCRVPPMRSSPAAGGASALRYRRRCRKRARR